jgi:hypothetical protein
MATSGRAGLQPESRVARAGQALGLPTRARIQGGGKHLHRVLELREIRPLVAPVSVGAA